MLNPIAIDDLINEIKSTPKFRVDFSDLSAISQENNKEKSSLKFTRGYHIYKNSTDSYTQTNKKHVISSDKGIWQYDFQKNYNKKIKTTTCGTGEFLFVPKIEENRYHYFDTHNSNNEYCCEHGWCDDLKTKNMITENNIIYKHLQDILEDEPEIADPAHLLVIKTAAINTQYSNKTMSPFMNEANKTLIKADDQKFVYQP